jgi:hypothetical protein
LKGGSGRLVFRLPVFSSPLSRSLAIRPSPILVWPERRRDRCTLCGQEQQSKASCVTMSLVGATVISIWKEAQRYEFDVLADPRDSRHPENRSPSLFTQWPETPCVGRTAMQWLCWPCKLPEP